MKLDTFAHYKPIRRLGQGGMAEVYEAIDTRTSNSVALKVLLPHLALKKVIRQRFLREAKVGIELNHPGIVKVYEAGEDRRPFIAMELVKGKTLESIVEQQPLPYKRVVSIGLQLSDALVAAHKQGIIHRDIKPRNIMITKDQVKIMDFGLARVVDTSSITEKHEIIGTLYYMSPEQTIGDTIDLRSDIFSLGVVLYQMLAGRRPFYGDHAGMVIHAILYSDPLRLSEIDHNLPKEFEQVVLKALQKKVNQRYQSMIDLRDDLLELDNVLKGKSVSLIASHIIAKETFDKDRGIYSELIGREQEMRVLQKYLTAILQGRSSAILLSGEAGIGKSRIVWELSQKARAQGMYYLSSNCQAQASLPYQPILGMIRDYFIHKGVATMYALGSFVNKHTGQLSSRMNIVEALALERASHDIETISQEQLWDTAAEVIGAMTREQPIIMHLDDLHWADVPTLNMFSYIIRKRTDNRLLIIGTFRPEEIITEGHPLGTFLQNMKRENLCHHLSLKRLDKERTRNLISSVFENSDFTERFTDSIFRETEGNPLFVLEVLRLLRDENIIIRHDTRWRVASDAIKIRIPHAVTEVILRRIKKLNNEEREIIDIAAVEGLFFRSDTLAHCLKRPRIKILRKLQNLESSHNLIHATKLGYQFDHGKIKDVVYKNLIPELKQEYHKIIGEYLKEIHGEQKEHAGKIAHHLFEGDLKAESLPYYIKAGEYSQTVFANEDALANFDSGLRIVEAQLSENSSIEAEKMKIKILRGIGQVKGLTGDYEESIDDLEAMIRMARRTGDKQEQMLGLTELGNVHFKKSEYSASYTYHKRALQICRELGDRQYEAQILIKLALASYHKETIEQPENLLVAALRILRNSKDRVHEGEACGYLAMLYVLQAKYKPALESFRKALRILRGAEHKYSRAFFLGEMGNAYRNSGQYYKALRHLRQALSIQEEIGDKTNQIISLNCIGLTYDVCGKYALAAEYYEKAYRIATLIGDLSSQVDTLGSLGWMHCYRGNDNQALEYYKKALGIARMTGDHWGESTTIRDRCWLYVKKGEYDQAFNWCSLAMKLARKRKDRRSEYLILHSIANMYSAQGDLQKALISAKEAITIGEQAGLEGEHWFCYTHLYLNYLKVGQTRRASHTLSKALEIMRKSDSQRVRGWLFYFTGIENFRRGSLQDALADIMKCTNVAKRTGDVLQDVNARLMAAEIYLRKKNYPRALLHARKALHRAKKSNRRFMIVESQIINARVLLKLINLEGAALHAEEAIKIAGENGMKPSLWQAHHILGDVCMKQKQYGQAQQELLEAKKIIDTIAADLDYTFRRTFLQTQKVKDLIGSIGKLEYTTGRKTKMRKKYEE